MLETAYRKCEKVCDARLDVKIVRGNKYLYQCRILSIMPVDGNTVIQYYNGEQVETIKTSDSASELAGHLQDDIFCNCYGSIYVNVFYIDERQKQDKNPNKDQLLLFDKSILPCSVRKKDYLSVLKSHF
jgi:hypothetical protein